MQYLEHLRSPVETTKYFKNRSWLEYLQKTYDLGVPTFLTKTQYEIALERLNEQLSLDFYTLACVDALVEYYIRYGESYSREYSLDLLCAAITFVSKLSDDPIHINMFYTETFNHIMVVIEFELLKLCWENETGFFTELWN